MGKRRRSKTLCAVLQTGEVLQLRVAASFLDRLCGLMPLPWRRASRGPLAFPNCSSVHTFGMDVPIDVAFVRDDCVVIKTVQAMLPSRVVSCPGACLALEQPCASGPWPAVGEHVCLWMDLPHVQSPNLSAADTLKTRKT